MKIPSLNDPEVFDFAANAKLSNELKRLLLLISRAYDPKMKLAIGGGIAVRDTGWGRHTDDVDIFARPVSAKRLVKGLAAQGVKTFWITDAHAVAYLDEDNAESLAAGEAPSVRVDILSTVTEPEASAIRTAVAPRVLGVPMKVFRADHLAAIKFLAGRPLDLIDFDEIIRLGADVERVRYIVASVDESRVAALMARARKALAPSSRGVRDGGEGRYLDRDALQRVWKTLHAAQGEHARRAS